MTIRIAKNSDLEQLSMLFDNYRMFYKKKSDIHSAKQFLTERMINKESIIYIAEKGIKLLGFTQLYPIFSSTNLKRAWLLNDLFVAKNQRGKGISNQLLNAAKKLAKETNAHGIMLETGKKNNIGNQLYPKAGFILNETANFYEWECNN